MPRYLVKVSATVTGVAEYSTYVDADDEAGAIDEATAEAETNQYGWELVSDTLEVQSGTCTAEEWELVEGTDDE